MEIKGSIICIATRAMSEFVPSYEKFDDDDDDWLDNDPSMNERPIR